MNNQKKKKHIVAAVCVLFIGVYINDIGGLFVSN